MAPQVGAHCLLMRPQLDGVRHLAGTDDLFGRYCQRVACCDSR
jgi:hypothetical protein